MNEIQDPEASRMPTGQLRGLLAEERKELHQQLRIIDDHQATLARDLRYVVQRIETIEDLLAELDAAEAQADQ